MRHRYDMGFLEAESGRRTAPTLRPLKGTTTFHSDWRFPAAARRVLDSIEAEIARIVDTLDRYYAPATLFTVQACGGTSEPVYTYHADGNSADEPSRRYRLWIAYRLVGTNPVEAWEAIKGRVPDNGILFDIDFTLRDAGGAIVAGGGNSPVVECRVALPCRSDAQRKGVERVGLWQHGLQNFKASVTELAQATEAIDDLLQWAARVRRVEALNG